MGVTGVLTLMLPVAVLCILPPSPVFTGSGPKGDPPIIPIDHQRCVAMKRETRRMEVPVPYFCHPKDPTGIPMPQQLDQQVLYMMMRLQWSGYRVCTQKITLPTHRYVPVPVCCRGWQRGPTGKCDTPTFTPPSALTGPCLNGGVLKKNGKCCYCPPGFSGPLCQHTTPPSRPGSPFPSGKPFRPPPVRPTMSLLPPQIRNRVNQLLQLREGSNNNKAPNNRPVPITPTLVKKLTDEKSSVPINTAYINSLPSRPTRPVKPLVNTASINKLVRNKPQRVPTNTAYINQLPTRNTPPRRVPINTAYINQLPKRQPTQQRIPTNTAYINQLPKQNQNPRRIPINTAYINQLPKTKQTPPRIPINTAYINQLPKRNPTPVRLPTNTAYINQLPKRNPTPNRQPTNTAYINQLPRNAAPRRIPASIAYINRRPQKPVARPPLNTANINPYVNPRPLRITVNTAHINKLPKIDPRRNRPIVNTAYINQLSTGPRRPIPNPRQTAYINRLLQRIPPNSPRPVIAPPVVVAPVLGVNPMFNPTAVNIVPPITRINPVQPPVVKVKPVQTTLNSTEDQSVEDPAEPEPTKGDNQDIVPPSEGPQIPKVQLPGIPRPNTPAISPEAQCKRILEVGVTRCFRDAGILAGPRDIFNPQNPEVARSICSQGKRLQPCIMAGETACGQGMRVIITRRMLASLLTAIGNLCTSVPMTTQNRKQCINGGEPVNKDGRQVCECPQGFGGELCEIPICVPACENQGLCENVDGSAKCVCTSEFYGDRCENAVVPVTTVTDPKPVDPPTHSMETSPNPVPVPVKKIKNNAQKITHDGEKEKIKQETSVAKMEIFGYPLWFVLAIILGLFGFLLVTLISCCLCLRCKRQKRNFEVTKEAVKMPVMDNVYTVGDVPPVYEAKGIPPLSYEEAKGETIRGLAKDLEKEVTEEKKEEEK